MEAAFTLLYHTLLPSMLFVPSQVSVFLQKKA
jgi:hypothetical protein